MLDTSLRSLCLLLANGAAAPMDDGLLELARRHRVDRLLAASTPRLRPDLRPDLRLAVAAELSAARDAKAVCAAAARRGIDLLLIKGAALAHTHYASPHLRPRDDIDLLVRRADLDRASAMLASMGYEREPEADAELWTGQRHYVKATAAGVGRIDLHWRAVNPLAFADALAFDEVWPRAVAVPALDRHARTLSAPDSLLLACIHRVAHHQDRVELLWLWDIHLLASRMTAEEYSLFASAAIGAKAAWVCARGLDLAGECFGTGVPSGVLEQLRAATGEPSAAFLGSALSPFDVARADLAALPGWRQRAGLVREHLFPPAAYMRRRYPRWPAALLPIAYVHRMVSGAPRWLRR